MKVANSAPGPTTSASVGIVNGYSLTFHKVSKDGSGKCDLEISKSVADSVYGIVYEIDLADEAALDRYEGSGYAKKTVHVSTATGLKYASAYVAITTDQKLIPYHWYKELVIAGAREHDLPAPYIQRIFEIPSQEDPDEGRRLKNEQVLKAFYGSQ